MYLDVKVYAIRLNEARHDVFMQNVGCAKLFGLLRGKNLLDKLLFPFQSEAIR
jgi:hypothetical protein